MASLSKVLLGYLIFRNRWRLRGGSVNVLELVHQKCGTIFVTVILSLGGATGILVLAMYVLLNRHTPRRARLEEQPA